jgi:DNA repair protein RecN (Recombination protein N)
MLKELRVRNFAIIEELSLGFGPGLTVLTGETGAGKSIVVGALGLVLGERGYTEMVKTGSTEAVVEAFFDTPGHPFLSQRGIASDEGIVVRRHVSAAGRTRAYINDTMVTVQALQELGKTLVDIHGQHAHQSLLSPEVQLRLLDVLGGLEEERERVSGAYAEVSALEKRLEDLRLSARERAQKTDLLSFQAGEIEAAGLAPGEEEELLRERNILGNLARLGELAEEAYALLYSAEGAATEDLSGAFGKLEEIAGIDGEAREARDVLGQALPLVEEAALALRGLREKYDADPARLGMLEERLELIRGLKRKYGDTVEAVLAHGEQARRELEELEVAEERAEGLEKDLEEKRSALAEAVRRLTAGRKKAARRLAEQVAKRLPQLALEKAAFRVSLSEAPVSAQGADQAAFLFCANPGEALKPLEKVVSGGELSRVMLAVKGALRGADDVPVLVFDEVDAGIGGAAARNVAENLKDLSRGRQVLCITHLPQIASLADAHFVIEKADRADRTTVSVREVSGAVREEEIARMLSGAVTETSLGHAREIIRRRS